MHLRDDIALRPLGPDPSGQLVSRVLVDERDTPLVVAGEDLQAAVAVGRRLALFVAYGDPYEDSLAIYLAEENRVLDSAVLAAMGATGRFTRLRLGAPDTIRFAFFGEREWTMTIHDRPRFGLPWFGPGLSRPFGWRRWFALGAASPARG